MFRLTHGRARPQNARRSLARLWETPNVQPPTAQRPGGPRSAPGPRGDSRATDRACRCAAAQRTHGMHPRGRARRVGPEVAMTARQREAAPEGVAHLAKTPVSCGGAGAPRSRSRARRESAARRWRLRAAAAPDARTGLEAGGRLRAQGSRRSRAPRMVLAARPAAARPARGVRCEADPGHRQAPDDQRRRDRRHDGRGAAPSAPWPSRWRLAGATRSRAATSPAERCSIRSASSSGQA